MKHSDSVIHGEQAGEKYGYMWESFGKNLSGNINYLVVVVIALALFLWIHMETILIRRI